MFIISKVKESSFVLAENAFLAIKSKSKESDVYSYGVVLLELITRKKALDSNIVEWVSSVWSSTEDINKIVDSGLREEFLDSNIMNQTIDVLLVALRCTEKEPGRRPTMRDVVRQLVKRNASIRGKRS